MTTIGYGDISATNDSEKILCIVKRKKQKDIFKNSLNKKVLTLVAVGIFGYSINNIQ